MSHFLPYTYSFHFSLTLVLPHLQHAWSKSWDKPVPILPPSQYTCLFFFSSLHFQSSRKLPSLLHCLHSPKLLLPDFPLTLVKILLEITPMAFSQSSISLPPAQNLTLFRIPSWDFLSFKNCIFMAYSHAFKHLFFSFSSPCSSCS